MIPIILNLNIVSFLVILLFIGTEFLFGNILTNNAATPNIGNNPVSIIKIISFFEITVNACPKNNVSICVIKFCIKNSTSTKFRNNFIPEYFACIIMKNIVKQTHALLIKKNNNAIGSPEEPKSLNSCEKGKKTFATINKRVYITVAKDN